MSLMFPKALPYMQVPHNANCALAGKSNFLRNILDSKQQAGISMLPQFEELELEGLLRFS